MQHVTQFDACVEKKGKKRKKRKAFMSCGVSGITSHLAAQLLGLQRYNRTGTLIHAGAQARSEACYALRHIRATLVLLTLSCNT